MTSEFEQLKNIRLKPEEKEAVRRTLAIRMESTHRERTFRWRFAPILSSALAGAVLLVSGVAYASQSSLPGDLLYPVKIGMAEPIQGVFKFSDEDKLDWELEKLDRRLSEEGEVEDEEKFDEEDDEEYEELLEQAEEARKDLDKGVDIELELEE